MEPRRLHGEDGVSLAIVLGFLMLFGILIPSILQLGDNNLLDTVRLSEQRGGVYVADGGLDGAIQYLRQPANANVRAPFRADLQLLGDAQRQDHHGQHYGEGRRVRAGPHGRPRRERRRQGSSDRDRGHPRQQHRGRTAGRCQELDLQPVRTGPSQGSTR